MDHAVYMHFIIPVTIIESIFKYLIPDTFSVVVSSRFEPLALPGATSFFDLIPGLGKAPQETAISKIP